MKQAFFLFIFSLLGIISNIACTAQQIALTTNGVANYTIVTAGDSKEEAAAKVLQANLQKISGANFSMNQPGQANKIHVLTAGNAAKQFPSRIAQLPGEEGVAVKVSNKEDIFIVGGAGNGMSNAVYEFLEKYLGCRYFTSGAILIPHDKNISVSSNISYSYTPVIKYRYVYFNPAFQGDYSAWNKLQNTPGQVRTPPFGLWVHSVFTLVPPETYFASHPEYYALRNGKRTKTQLDLTNPDVLRIAKQSLAAIIEKNPQASIFSVSQMDNNGYCECDNCKRKAAETGSQSGIIVDFVNKLAAAFPNKTISTLAYNYSRAAPANITPAKNVNIMFCATGADHSIPFTADRSGGSVSKDLNAWSRLTGNIFFWDYLVDFRHLYLPFPVYHTLQPNIQFLASNKVSAAFMQGWGYKGSDMTELKTYLIAQLLWDPGTDIKAAQDEFIKFYYGDAAPYISQYLDAITGYVQSHHINLTTTDAPLDHVNDFLSPSQIRIYRQYFNKAEKAVARNVVYAGRVQDAEQSLRYTILDGISKLRSNEKDSNYLAMLQEFKEVAAKAGVDKVEESSTNTLNDFVADQVWYQKNKFINNLAAGASAVITNPSAYKVNNTGDLFDGLSGNKTIDSKWVAFQQPAIEMVIDLKKQIRVDSVSATFMHNPQFKVQLPAYVTYAVSNDGKNFTGVGTAKNTWAGLGVKEELKKFTVKTPGNITARYIKLNFIMVNSPNITGDDLPQAMLCDEISVR